MARNMHVGPGTTRGSLTYFPIWGSFPGERGYSSVARAVRITKSMSAAQVIVENGHSHPLLLRAGQLLEPGLVVARSVLVGALTTMAVEVEPDADLPSEAEDPRDPGLRRLLRGVRPRPHQAGVLIGVGGRPLYAEVFDAQATLVEQFEAIILRAALTAHGQRHVQRNVRTPLRLAYEFLQRFANVPAHPVGRAGVGLAFYGEDDDLEVSVLHWRGRDVQIVLVDPGHPLRQQLRG